MATELLTNQTSDTTGTAYSFTEATTVVVHRDSVFDGANVRIYIATDDQSAEYTPIGDPIRTEQDSVNVEAKGTYYIKAVQAGSGANTSITVESTVTGT